MNTSTRMMLLGPVVMALAAAGLKAQSNVVVIISDDAGWADFGFMRSATSDANPGSKGPIPTPNLDRLAGMGVTFTQGYAASVCSPSRAMITTGMYGQRFGYQDNISDSDVPINQAMTPQGLPASATTIWERMQVQGYDTAVVGKWHLGRHPTGGGVTGNLPQNQGVEFFQGILNGSRGYFAGSQSGGGELVQTISDGTGGVTSSSVIEGNYSGQYVTDVFGDQSASYIRSKAGSADPYFLYTSFTAPHTPMQATTSDLAYIDSLNVPGFTGNRRTQAAMQYAMDRNVGKILGAIDDPNGDGDTSDSQFNSTLILFINDNGGDSSDADPNYSSNGLLRNGKGSQFEGGIRVPMIVSGAGVNSGARGTVSTALVHAIDVLPTAVAAGGGTFGSGETLDGVNLLPIANGDLTNAHDHLVVNRYTGQQAGLRQGDWKYLFNAGTVQLYNLANDISESNNVASQNPERVKSMQQLLTSYDVQFDKPRYDLSAASTNQFDHFRFREEAFTAGNFSTASAWQDGQAGTGSATMTYRDAYANSELTFRAKASGSYTVTNDLLRYDGLTYMANRINLASATGSLAGTQSATIGGNAILLTKSLSGAAPAIDLSAHDVASPGRFTFRVNAPIELYDDLTLSGDGNQKFEINGSIREYRGGMNINKVGSADVTLRGGVDISGTFDLQGGDVSVIDNDIRGNVRIRSTAALVVGGTGFNEESLGGIAPPIVSNGLTLHYNAALDVSGDAVWTDQSGNGNLAFATAASSSQVTNPSYPNITHAYSIPATGGASGLNNFFETAGPRSQQDASFEVIFHVANTNAGTDHVILEAGGADRGVSFILNNGALKFNVDGDGTDNELTTNLSTGWHQAVGVIDLATAGVSSDTIRLYIDNALVGTMSNLNINDWAGGNLTGLGAGVSSVTGVSAGTGNPYGAEIAVARYYANSAFSAAEVQQNYDNARFDPGQSVLLPTHLVVDGDYIQDPGGKVALDVIGNQHDQLIVTGGVHLAGALQITTGTSAIADYLAFNVIAAPSIAGHFDAIEGVSVSSDRSWAVTYSADVGVFVTLAIPGDSNLDRAVDFDDLLVLAQHYQSGSAMWTTGDFTGDGVVDFSDLLIVAQHYDTSLVQAAAHTDLTAFETDWTLARQLVPEPVTLTIAPLALCAYLLRARRP